MSVWRDAATGEATAWWAPFLRALHEPWLVLRDAFRDRVPVRSGFIALWCMEALIPLLVLAATLARPLGYEDAVLHGLSTLLGDSIFGYTAGQLEHWLRGLLSDTGLAQLGIAGVVTTLFIGWQLFVAAVYDMNALSWTRMPRDGGIHLLQFVTFMVWTAALLIGGTAASAAAWHELGWFATPLPWLLEATVLALGLRGFTQGAASWRGAFAGGLAGAVWLELIKSWFYAYTTSRFGTSSLATFYQALGFIPIFLFWMHLTWFSVLLSAVAARQYDYHPVLWRHYVRTLHGEQRPRIRVDERLVGAIWDALADAPHDLAYLSERLDLHPQYVWDALADLQDMKWIRRNAVRAFERDPDRPRETAAEAEAAWRRAFTAKPGTTDPPR